MLRSGVKGLLKHRLSQLPRHGYSETSATVNRQLHCLLFMLPCQGCQSRQLRTYTNIKSDDRRPSFSHSFRHHEGVRAFASDPSSSDMEASKNTKSASPKTPSSASPSTSSSAASPQQNQSAAAPPTSSSAIAASVAAAAAAAPPKEAPVETIVRVVPKSKPRLKTDFSKTYTDNIYITTVRAMYEYLLQPKHLNTLKSYQRRSPYPEYGGITVFLRRDVETKAKAVWGSLDAVNTERKKRQAREAKYNKMLFDTKRAAREYKQQHQEEKEEVPFVFNVSTIKEPKQESIFKTGAGKVVLYAIAVNAANGLLKFIAWLYSGSHSMFSEFIHSMADTANQIILALGLHQSIRKPDLDHPYGWANFRNVASLISGVGIFCLGSGVSLYHGIQGLMHPETFDNLYWALVILAGSLISEGSTLIVAMNQVRERSRAMGMSMMEYVLHGSDPSTNVVLLEDAAAVTGVVIAATCMGITYYTGNPVADAVGSIMIGTLLGGVASFIVYTNAIALVGRSIPPDKKLELTRELENDRMIRALHDVKATDMGGTYVKFKAEVDFDGREITRLYMENQDIDKMLADLKSLNSPEELESFMLKHGENIVDTLGGEVDRIETALKKRHPEVRHVDLEQL